MRLHSIPVVFSLLITAPAVALHAQTVEDVVAKNLQAKGGAALLRETNSVRMSGRVIAEGPDVTITTSSMRPNLFLTEVTVAGQKRRRGFDGQTMWMAADGMKPMAAAEGPDVEAAKQTSQIDSPLLDYKEKGTRVEMVGTETEGTRRLHHLVITPKTGPAMHYYIDAETGLESKIAMEGEQNGQKMRMEMRFSDFKTVDGRTVPYTTTVVNNGRQVSQMRFDKVEFNVPMDAALFRMPR